MLRGFLFASVWNPWRSKCTTLCEKGLPDFEHPAVLNQSSGLRVRDEPLDKAKLLEAIWPYKTGNATTLDDGFAKFFKKMKQGSEVRILVVGGSETAGIGCGMPTGERKKLCAWSSHLSRWLSRFAKVRLTNIAQPGTTSGMFLSQVAVVAIAVCLTQGRVGAR